MRILITGGAGFIGSNLALRLVPKHPRDHFIVLDKLTYAGNLANLEAVADEPNFTFVRGDIGDCDLAEGAMEGVDVVANLAAESHVDRSIYSCGPFIETNIQGTQNLLEAARRRKSLTRFVQVSTDEVYGSLGPADPPFTEATPLAPNSPYAASKAAADLLVRAFVETYRLPALVTRCSNNYGPFQFPEKLIPLMLTNALEGEPLPVYGDGRQVRDWIHVEDHCAGLELAIYHGRPGQVYNFGGDCELANLDLLKRLLAALAEATGEPLANYEKLITFITDRPGHDRRYAMDFSQTTARLAWRPERRIGQGLAETVAWYLENEAWWRAVKSGEYRDYYQRQYGQG